MGHPSLNGMPTYISYGSGRSVRRSVGRSLISFIWMCDTKRAAAAVGAASGTNQLLIIKVTTIIYYIAEEVFTVIIGKLLWCGRWLDG